jgi:SAM-dependent methyltransferase
MKATPIIEAFKPIPIRRGRGAMGRAFFTLRMAVDLQLLTCRRFLAPHMARCEGAVLDVGCGEMPFRDLLAPSVNYSGIDVAMADEFGMSGNSEIVPFDGRVIPFVDASFDHVLCTEVLEHVEDPAALVAEIYRVLKPGGALLATVPFSARVHYAPHDFHRFTRYRLASLFANFATLTVEERGEDLSVIANKMIVVCMRLARLHPPAALIWRLPVFASLLPVSAVALGVAHLSLVFGLGSKMDPLGYGILARKDEHVEDHAAG